MTKQIPKMPRDHIIPLLINGMHGRMLRIPSSNAKQKNKEILLVYGLHATLEQVFALAVDLSQYGNVTCPDLPGVGGMDALYKIGLKPSLENMADYVASFMKLRYNHKRVTVVGISYGFAIATKTLQRNPHLAEKTNLAISIAGFVHKDDYTLTRRQRWLLKALASIGSTRVVATLIQYITFFGPFMRYMCNKYSYISGSAHKQHSAENKVHHINFELHLWRINDARTLLYSLKSIIKLDLCSERLAIPAIYIGVLESKFTNRQVVEQHTSVIYEPCSMYTARVSNYAASLIAPAKEVEQLLPKKVRVQLQKSAP